MTNISSGVDAKKRQVLVESTDVLTRRGIVFYWDDRIDLKTVGPYSYAIETQDDPVIFRKIEITSPPDKGMGHMSFELFEGGTVSGGSPSIVSITNVRDLTPSPFNSNVILEGVTIDSPGSLFYTRNMVGFRTALFEDEFGPFVLKPNTTYYWTLTNVNNNENENLLIQISAVRIP